jgi:hypothetical protein
MVQHLVNLFNFVNCEGERNEPKKNVHTTLEMMHFGQLICCLKVYEGERSEQKKNLT